MNRTTVVLPTTSDFSGWRAWSRKLLHEGLGADDLCWVTQPPSTLYASSAQRTLPRAPSVTTVPRALARLFPAVFVSEAPDRLELLYFTLQLLRDGQSVPDDLISKLEKLAEESRRKALDLRCQMPDSRDPDWKVLMTSHSAALIDSQAKALSDLRTRPWIVSGPDRILCWTGSEHRFGPGLDNRSPDIPEFVETALKIATAGPDNAWWHGITPVLLYPEEADIRASSSLPNLRGQAIDCQICELCKAANRTVPGEGPSNARIMFIGEQPGDQEDLQGRPFVGPAGQLFDRALREAGGHRTDAWVTNAVKHFKFVQKGARRIHQKPDASDIAACHPWLDSERHLLNPKVTVMLGVTAASAIFGRPVTVSRERSRYISLDDGSIGLVTVHSSYLLRLPDEESKTREYIKFVNDLRMAISALAE